MLACREVACATSAALGALFGIAANTVATAVRRTRTGLAQDLAAQNRYRRLIQAVDSKSQAAT